jgi:hypothetical protein
VGTSLYFGQFSHKFTQHVVFNFKTISADCKYRYIGKMFGQSFYAKLSVQTLNNANGGSFSSTYGIGFTSKN